MESWRHRLPRVAPAAACLVLALVCGDGTASTVPALLVFGDSVVDAGINNDLKTLIKCNFPPYGRDFVGQVSTGRFSNGKVPGDILASRIGLKEYLPAYSSALNASEILTGVTFASGGSGFDPLTPSIVRVISMTEQLGLLQQYKTRLSSEVGAIRAGKILSEAVYMICSGSDDFANTYFGGFVRKNQFSLAPYVNFVANHAASFVNELITLGARKISFVGLPPLGCLPSQKTMAGKPASECEPLRNEAARMYNARISDLLLQIQTNWPGVKVEFQDAYSILLDIIQNPSKYGMEEVTKGCCGTGRLEVSVLCNRLTPITCPDDNKYLFWDSYHLTQRGYEILVEKFVEKSSL